MKTVCDTPAAERCSANNSLRTVSFYCSAPGAKSVELVGTFNQRQPVLMRPGTDEWWFFQLELPLGQHQCHFLVDGNRKLNPQTSGTARDNANQPVSLIVVN